MMVVVRMIMIVIVIVLVIIMVPRKWCRSSVAPNKVSVGMLYGCIFDMCLQMALYLYALT